MTEIESDGGCVLITSHQVFFLAHIKVVSHCFCICSASELELESKVDNSESLPSAEIDQDGSAKMKKRRKVVDDKLVYVQVGEKMKALKGKKLEYLD